MGWTRGGRGHLKIETRLRVERFESEGVVSDLEGIDVSDDPKELVTHTGCHTSNPGNEFKEHNVSRYEKS